ncbi:MAG: TlyA family rRNA (cytidine-2-O)-methyltransferase [Glaciihabitans sp.]|jgi:23S rRNA (cytidine1920-2'-O)/16S rRNA (cytidine1409-2'-O)-methyltransferase|nr:TlyA family rRNA (cytidine-2-O)-methyltransferase [Glaciihabitans sp.]
MAIRPAGMSESRLDAALSERGLARSRSHAARLIADGLVTVDGTAQVKPSFRVAGGQRIEVAGADHYVSRAAHKLVAALDTFGIDPNGRVALDAGASTGGFSQVLLERGVKHVLAIDVGHGQLALEIQENSALTSTEGFNIRDITREWVGTQLRSPEFPNLVVADLSFISLGLVLGALRDAVDASADFVLLVKPQFEVGRSGIREGIVRDRGLRQDAVSGVLWTAWDLGLPTAGVIPSPIAGNAGNREYLVWLSVAAGSNPTDWIETVAELE